MGWKDTVSNAMNSVFGGGSGSGQSLGQRLGNTNQGTHWSGSGNYRGVNATSARGAASSQYKLNADGSYTDTKTGARYTLRSQGAGKPKMMVKDVSHSNVKPTGGSNANIKTAVNNSKDGGTTVPRAGTSSQPGKSNTKDGATPVKPTVKTPVKTTTPVKAPVTPPKTPVVTPPKAPVKTPAQIQAETDTANLAARNKFTGLVTHDIADAFKGKNLKTTDYQDDIDHYIADLLKPIKPTSDYSKYSYQDAGEKVLGGIRTDQIEDYNQDLNAKYGSGNYGSTLFPPTRDDPILTSILQPQFNDASSAVKAAFDRGTLGQTGYDTAMKGLGGQQTAGMSSLQSTGSGVMGGYIKDINDLITGAHTQAGKWDFGSNWEPQDAISNITTTGADYQGRLEGDIRTAVGGKQFFNWNDLIRSGGMAQGLYNPATDTTGAGGSTLAKAIADRKKREDTSRGLGTQGSF